MVISTVPCLGKVATWGCWGHQGMNVQVGNKDGSALLPGSGVVAPGFLIREERRAERGLQAAPRAPARGPRPLQHASNLPFTSRGLTDVLSLTEEHWGNYGILR